MSTLSQEKGVHILGPQFSTFVRSVQLCCEEKSIPYTLGMSINGNAIDLHSSEYLRINPFGKVPILLHGEHQLCETASICRYLDEAFEGYQLQPEAAWERALVDQFSAWLSIYVDEAIVRRYLLEFYFPKGENGTVRKDYIRAAEPEVARMLSLLELQLTKQPYLVTESFSVADALVAPMLDYLGKLPPAAPLLQKTPHLSAYLKRIQDRPSARNVFVAA